MLTLMIPTYSLVVCCVAAARKRKRRCWELNSFLFLATFFPKQTSQAYDFIAISPPLDVYSQV